MREDWVEIELADIKEDSLIGLVRSSAQQNTSGIGTPYLKMDKLDMDGNVNLQDLVYVDADSEELEKYSLQSGDILLNTRNSYELVGKSGIVRKINEPIIFNNNIMRIRVKDQLDPYYVCYQLISPFVRRQMDKFKKATTSVCALYQRNLFPLKFNLPSIPEQRAIVAKIEELFSDLDKGIADLKKAQDQLKVYRQAVLKKAFEGELTKEWRDNNALEPSFNFLKEVAKERKEAEVDKKTIYHKKISHEFEFSQDTSIKTWSKGTLDKLIYIAARIGWRGLKKSEYTEEGPLFLSVHSLNHGKYVDYTEAYHISEERYIESPEIQLQEGDVLLCKDGAGIGKIGIVKDLPRSGSVNSSLLVIRGMNILSQEFIYYLFSGPKLQSIVSQRITGSATPHLFQNDIRKFELLIPPIEEQYQIVQEIESRLSVCDKVEESIAESLEKAKALRQSILKKAFEGTLLSEEEIAACKAAPGYEPASVLLDRIRKEK